MVLKESTRSLAILPGSAHEKVRNVTKKCFNIYSTMKTKSTEALGRQRAKPSKIKA